MCECCPESMPITYQCPFLVLHHGLDGGCLEPMADCILNGLDQVLYLLSCGVHDTARLRGRDWSMWEVKQKN